MCHSVIGRMPIWFSDCWGRAMMIGKAKWKPGELPLLISTVNPKIKPHSWKDCRDQRTRKRGGGRDAAGGPEECLSQRRVPSRSPGLHQLSVVARGIFLGFEKVAFLTTGHEKQNPSKSLRPRHRCKTPVSWDYYMTATCSSGWLSCLPALLP